MNLIVVYCNCGYLMVDIDLLWLDKVWFCSYFDFEVLIYGLMLWDFDWVFKVDGFVGVQYKKLCDVLGLLCDVYCCYIGVEYVYIFDFE